MLRLPQELKAELSLAQHKGSLSEKREARGAAEGFGECGCISNVSFAVFNMPYFRSNCFLQPDSPTKGTR